MPAARLQRGRGTAHGHSAPAGGVPPPRTDAPSALPPMTGEPIHAPRRLPPKSERGPKPKPWRCREHGGPTSFTCCWGPAGPGGMTTPGGVSALVATASQGRASEELSVQEGPAQRRRGRWQRSAGCPWDPDAPSPLRTHRGSQAVGGRRVPSQPGLWLQPLRNSLQENALALGAARGAPRGTPGPGGGVSEAVVPVLWGHAGSFAGRSPAFRAISEVKITRSRRKSGACSRATGPLPEP